MFTTLPTVPFGGGEFAGHRGSSPSIAWPGGAWRTRSIGSSDERDEHVYAVVGYVGYACDVSIDTYVTHGIRAELATTP